MDDVATFVDVNVTDDAVSIADILLVIEIGDVDRLKSCCPLLLLLLMVVPSLEVGEWDALPCFM